LAARRRSAAFDGRLAVEELLAHERLECRVALTGRLGEDDGGKGCAPTSATGASAGSSTSALAACSAPPDRLIRQALTCEHSRSGQVVAIQAPFIQAIVVTTV
jgi:hypothetical protein